ncbi:MAG: NDP-sugar synthase [Thermoplasmata archaeon]|nr:MAG: NDP-sugar synthase [Thermoplasmata archaeon]
MEAIILAGGFGTRLAPLTYTRAKPLLPILNKPMITYLIDSLPKEIDKVVLAVNYRKDQIEKYFKENDVGREIVVNEEPKPLGTGGAVKFAEKHITGTFVVLNSDIISSLNLKEMIGFHRRVNAVATISLWPVDNVSEFGVVEIKEDSRITSFIEKPKPEEAPSNLINAGAYCLEPFVLDYIDTGRLVSMEQEIFPRLIEDTKAFYGYRISEYWVDVGRIESYLKVNRLLLDHNGREYVVGERSEIKGRIKYSSLGCNVFVDEHSIVESSIVFDNVRVEKNAVVLNSVVGAGCVIKKGARVVNCVVGDDEVVEENAVVENTKVWTKPLPEGYPKRQVGNVIKK